ncbi:MAG TPA: PEGA domain-containing protein, partial [Burkholderiales bacterium]|nr:PEGA domain-containing protein [Burkholderiales bacterium]
KPPAPAAAAPAPAETAEKLPPKKMARLDRRVEHADKAAAPSGVGRLELAVAPWGEVLIDGKRRGVSPPLRVVEVAPGAHTIEIRNSTFPAHVEKVQLKPGQSVRIRHRFR